MAQDTHTTQPPQEESEELLPIVQLLKEYGNPREYNLMDEADVAYVEKMFDDLIEFSQSEWISDMLPDIMTLLDGDLKTLETTKPEQYERIQRFVAKGQWLTLDQYGPEEVTELFRTYFEYFFDYTWEEIDRKTRAVLLTIPKFEERDNIKQEWREAIAQSHAEISEETIQVNGKDEPSTVQQWLADFDLFLNERPIDPLLIVEYLGSSENPKKVDEHTRDAVESLLRYTEIIARSSLTPEGAEDMFVFPEPISGHYHIFDRGEVRDTNVEIPEKELEALRYSYNVDEHGKPQSFAHQVQTSPLFTEGVESRYATPEKASAEKTPIEDLTSPPTEVVPLMDREVEAANAPEEATVVEPVLPDEKLVPPPPVDDHAELPTMQLDEPVPVATPVAEPSIDYNALAHQVLDEVQILLPSLELEKRFLSVLSSYFRGVRDKMEAGQALRDTEEEGGVNLPKQQVEAVMSAAEEAMNQAPAQQQSPVSVSTADSPMKPTLQMVQEKMQSEQSRHAEMGVEQPTEEVQDIFSNVNPIFSANQTVRPTRQDSRPRPVTPKQQPSVSGGEKQRMMTPIDELRNMNLEEFRRLADTPKESAEKILNMINLLAQESLAKKADGVAAWKASELHKMYVEIGNRSLESGKSVDVVMSEMQTTGKNALMQTEFDAIADMNTMVRF